MSINQPMSGVCECRCHTPYLDARERLTVSVANPIEAAVACCLCAPDHIEVFAPPPTQDEGWGNGAEGAE